MHKHSWPGCVTRWPNLSPCIHTSIVVSIPHQHNWLGSVGVTNMNRYALGLLPGSYTCVVSSIQHVLGITGDQDMIEHLTPLLLNNNENTKRKTFQLKPVHDHSNSYKDKHNGYWTVIIVVTPNASPMACSQMLLYYLHNLCAKLSCSMKDRSHTYSSFQTRKCRQCHIMYRYIMKQVLHCV